jgi:REP element-mobilizing transposase RayT
LLNKLSILNLSCYGKLIYYPVFFTATIRNWKKLLKPGKYKVVVLNNLKQLVQDNKIMLYAFCIRSNHIHLIWQVRDDNKPSEIQKQFLERASKEIKKDLELYHPEVLNVFSSTQKDRSYHFWKRRPLSIELFSPKIFEQNE